METSTPLQLSEYWHMILRRKWQVVAAFCACVIGAGVLCVVLPESYRSQTLILVEGQKIPENYVKAIIGPTIEERLNTLQQQVMSRTVLMKMIEEFGLYPDVVRTNGVDSVVERLRRDVRVTTGMRSQRGGIDTFTISFAHENPITAMNVTAKLASHFIEENLKVREQLVEGASEFLEQELALAKDRLEAQERALSHYKTKYMGELPEQVQANISALDRLQAQHSAATEALQKSTDRLTLIEKMIKEYESPGMSAPGTVQGPGGAVVVDPQVLRLSELEKNLATLSAEYKDTYPDVVALKQEIRELKAQLKVKREKVEDKDESKRTSDSSKEMKPVDLYLRELVRQRDEARLEITSLRERLARTRTEMKEYEARVEKAPTREQELEILVRDYNNLKENYRTLLDKKLNARLAENLEKRQKGEQFRIVDPANLPQKPETPDRFKIMLIGIVLGCGLGVGSVVALESFKPVFRRSEDVESLLQFRVLASIPNFGDILGRKQQLLLETGASPVSAKSLKGLPSPVSTVGGRHRSKGDDDSVIDRDASRTGYYPRRYPVKSGVRRELDLIGKWSPLSVVAEQFRVAATRLALLQLKNGGKVTMITSALKGEGKSVVSVNLAYALARDMAKRTLLVDADLKCPMVHQYMGVSQSPGLRDVLEGGRTVDSCLHREGGLPLSILTSGLEPGRMLDLAYVQKLPGILSEIKGQFDHIIIDAPPVLPLADMHVLAGMADILAFVIRAGQTPRSVVENAIHALGVTDNLSIVLNGIEAAAVPYYMQESYKYLVEDSKSGRYEHHSYS